MTETASTLTTPEAEEIIESLRKGIPPRRFTPYYTSGDIEKLAASIRERHLANPAPSGKIRFVSGSWGAGKTHFLRLLRDEAFDARHLVATVELDAKSTPFNKFEKVFREIVASITSPEMYSAGNLQSASPFGEVLRRALLGPSPETSRVVSHEHYAAHVDKLSDADDIDPNFRRVVSQYWKTFLSESTDTTTQKETRDRLLQWFYGEGTKADYKEFGIRQLVTGENSKRMLQSLGRFVTHVGYSGLVILFDEAEMSYSTMRKSNLKQAHNNLLYLINGIKDSKGLFLIYATTPDFYMDEKYGILIYGALAQRIGKPDEYPPFALDLIWNLDCIQSSIDDYLHAVDKIRSIYLTAYPEYGAVASSPAKLRAYVTNLLEVRPEFSRMSKWRVVITGAIKVLDMELRGREWPPVTELQEDIMNNLRRD